MVTEKVDHSGIDIFISFSAPDKEWADWVAWTLSEHGYSVLYQPWDFAPGTNFVLQMNKAARSTKTIAIISQSYLSSQFAQPEWAAAFAQDPTGFKRQLIPIRISECDLSGTLLAQIVYIDLVGIFDHDLAKQRLLGGLLGSVPLEAPGFPLCTGKSPPFPGTIADPATRASGKRKGDSSLPPVGLQIPFSTHYVPPSFRGLQVHVGNPLILDFILDSGDASLGLRDLGEVALRLTKYFLTALTVPNEHLWVNLSPYEESKVIPEDLGKTQMGVDLLLQDYILKQVTSTALYPERAAGQSYWKRIYEKTGGQADPSTVNTYNKVWITPLSAKIVERGRFVMIDDRELRVQIDKDYLASINDGNVCGDFEVNERLVSDIFKDVILPLIESDVNIGSNFAVLRQIYDSLLLAVWYKQAMIRSIVAELYIDHGITGSMEHSGNSTPQSVYSQYVETFKEGVFSYIREEAVTSNSSEIIPRKYFSGGFNAADTKQITMKEVAANLLLQSASTSGSGQLYWVRMNLSDDDRDTIDKRFYSADEVGGIDLSIGNTFELDLETSGEGFRFILSDELHNRLLSTGMARLRPSIIFVKRIRNDRLDISDDSDLSEMLADVAASESAADNSASPQVVPTWKGGLVGRIHRAWKILLGNEDISNSK